MESQRSDTRLLTVGEVAAKLNVPVSWVYGAAERGELPSYKIGKYRRFNPQDIHAWIEARKAQPMVAR